MTDDDKSKLLIEKIKLSSDLYKHLSTLATGSIVLVATLLDKFPKPLKASRWLVAALILFAGCITNCLYGLFIRATAAYEEKAHISLKRRTANLLSFWTFEIGIACLVVFAIANIETLNSK